MRECSVCGEGSPQRARFCLACGARFDVVSPPREQRKTVTIVFADLVGSTAMGERLDPEAVRGVMSRYSAQMREALERHGGRVEKFIGDAVMAVFGVPMLHEDDALRAVRATLDMRLALMDLNENLESRWGVRLQVRTGISTGSVVAGDPAAGHSFVSGDAVNLAARLEQAAAPGQILLSEATFRQVRHAVSASPVVPMSLKGKSKPVAAFELADVEPEADAAQRGIDLPLVGRKADLVALREAYAAASSERRCRLICLVGSAGVGKSRVAREFLGVLEDRAQVLAGRCLPYGEGITYWPVVEVVRQAAGISPEDTRDQARRRIAALLDGQPDAGEVVRGVAGLLELSDDVVSPQESSWGVRRLLEALAVSRPLVVVLDDLQWAEPTFIDLVEYLVEFGGQQAILILGLARPELVELRPGFPTGEIVVLEPLGAGHSARLVESVLGDTRVAEDVSRRVVDAAAGQPLFVVEYVRMLIEDGLVAQRDGVWRFTRDVSSIAVPSSIEALLGARLDRLSAAEREVIQAAAVIGQEFEVGAVGELVSAALAPDVSVHLHALVAKQLVRREPPEAGRKEAVSFSHLLIRDVAYGALLKQTRSELHERFAGWLTGSAGEQVEQYEEILGFHLEQAYRYRTELGPIDDHARRLAHDARQRLATAGRRALAREDAPAAANLLGRAAALSEPSTVTRLDLLFDLAGAQADTGQLKQADALFDEVQSGARLSGQPLLMWRARVERAALSFSLLPDAESARATAEQAITMFTELNADAALGRAWNTVSNSRAFAGDIAQALAAREEALRYALRASDRRVQAEALTGILIYTWGGPTPAPAGINRCQQVLDSPDVPRQVTAFAMVERAPLLAMLGRFADARRSYRDGTAILHELGLTPMAAQVTQEGADVEMRAGDPRAAELCLRAGCEVLEAMGERGILASSLPRLGEALYAQGKYDEAESLAQRGRELTASDDVDAQVRWRRLLAKVLAQREEFLAAEQLAREAARLIAPTDYINLRADSIMDLGEVLSITRDPVGAHAAIAQALDLYQRKQNQIAAERARQLLLEASHQLERSP